MILSKPKLIAAGIGVIIIAGLIAVVQVQAARLDAVTSERNQARQQAAELTAQMVEALAHQERLSHAVTQRERELRDTRARVERLQAKLKTISAEVMDENWQECRAVPVPVALIEQLRTESADGR